MKANIGIFSIIAVFFFILAVVYTWWSVGFSGHIEWTGSIALLFSGLLNGFIASFLWLTQRKLGGVLVEDRPDSDIDDGDPEQGEFSPWSWWPLVLAFGAGLFVIGLSVGGYMFWLTMLSVPIILVSVIGWVYEYYRGYFAR